MKKIVALALASMMTMSLLTGCGSPEAKGDAPVEKGEVITYKISSGVPDSHFEVAALKEMEKYVEEKTNGTIDIEIYTNNQLGDDNEALQLIQQGVVQMCPTGTSVLSNYEPSFNILSSPYLFKDIDEVSTVLNGDWGQMLLDSLQGTGFKGMGVGLLGMTNISNSRAPLVNAADYKGLKIRLVPNPLLVETFEALGASPVTMSFNELFAAMQQGVVDGQLNPFTTIYSSNFQEVQKYITRTSDFASLVCFVVNEAEFAKLTPEQQTALQEGVDIAVQYMADQCVAEETAAEAKLLETGKVEINDLADGAKAELLQKSLPVIEKFAVESNEELWNALKTELGI